MPFPVQRIQTDRGREFFAYEVQERLMEWGIKFRPIRPGAPHLNGKVERSQKTDLEEFYGSVDLHRDDLGEKLSEWQHYYNCERPHGSLGGKTPLDRYAELMDRTPLLEEVETMYDSAKERLQVQNYNVDLALKEFETIRVNHTVKAGTAQFDPFH